MMGEPIYEKVEARLLGYTQSTRLRAVSDVLKLPEEAALRLLQAGLVHWDVKLRKKCAQALYKLMGEKSDSIIIDAAEDRRIPYRLALTLLANSSTKDAAGFVIFFQNHPRTDLSDISRRIIRMTKSPWLALYRWTTSYQHRKYQDSRMLIKQLAADGIEETLAKLGLDDMEPWFTDEGFVRDYPELAAKLQKKLAAERRKKKPQKKQVTEVKPPAKKGPSTYLVDLGKSLDVRVKHVRYFAAKVREDDGSSFEDNHYTTFTVRKRDGGERQLSAPSKGLKILQRKIYEKMLLPQELHESCHGFRPGRSIVTNASVHVGKRMVINLDIKDFFPSVHRGRVYGILSKLPGSSDEVGFLTSWTTLSEEGLPQGAPTSPALANLVCRRMDSRLSGLADKIGASYTRYADDLTFSGDAGIECALPLIRTIIEEEGFSLAEKKTRLQRSGRRQEVTGLVVNSKVSIPRDVRKKLRAAAHRKSQGLQPVWNGVPMKEDQWLGHLAFVHSVDPELAAKLRNQAQVR